MKQQLRRWLVWLWAASLRACGVFWYAHRCARHRGLVLVIGLHRVLDEADARTTDSLPAIVIRTWRFERLLNLLRARYDPVALDAAVEAVGRPSARLRVAVTFDDGWRDTHDHAWPIARAAGVPIAVFHCPGLSGTVDPFWPEQVSARLRDTHPRTLIAAEIERLKPLSPGDRSLWFLAHPARGPVRGGALMTGVQVRELHAHGVTIGAHTMTHPLLPGLDRAQAAWEIAAARDTLEDLLEAPCLWFAYPNGSMDPLSAALVAEAGLRFSLVCSPGLLSPRTHPLAIPRVNVSDATLAGPWGGFSPLMFEYRVFWRAWRAGCGPRLTVQSAARLRPCPIAYSN